MSRSAALCLLALAVFAGSARAGTVYVPLPGLTQAGSASYEAEVTVANPAAIPDEVPSFGWTYGDVSVEVYK